MIPAANPAAERLVAGLNNLRKEQRSLATKLSELQMDLNEHKLVIQTLENVDTDRRCFRLVGGVLVERKVGEVCPALVSNKDKMTKLIEVLEKQLTDKGKEINEYIEKHNIRGHVNSGDTKEDKEAPTKSGVLVASDNEAKVK